MIRILFLIITGCTLWFAGKASYELWRYLHLDASAPAEVREWGIKEESECKFFVTASYTFRLEQGCFEGKTVFKEPRFLNRPSAELEQKKWSQLPFRVWYNAKDPRLSSLQKLFPLKSLLYGILTIGVLGYFSYKAFQASP